MTLKGDDCELGSLGVVDGSKLLLIASSAEVVKKGAAAATAAKTVSGILQPLVGLVAELDDFERFLLKTSGSSSGGGAGGGDENKLGESEEHSVSDDADLEGWNKKRNDGFLRLQEFLMRIILALDGLNPPSSLDETAADAWKLERREGIKSVQAQLNRLDRLVREHPTR